MYYPQNQVMIVLVAVIISCTAHIGGDQSSLQTADPQVFCGRTLAKALAFLCYDDISGSKRSVATMYDAILAPYYKSRESQIDWPWLSPHKARSFDFATRGKRYPGVVNECCDKACSISELLTYC